jgi:hypothetical protein
MYIRTVRVGQPYDAGGLLSLERLEEAFPVLVVQVAQSEEAAQA